VGPRGDNGSGSNDLSSGSEKLGEEVFSGSSGGGVARVLGAFEEAVSELSCDRGAMLVAVVEPEGCAG